MKRAVLAIVSTVASLVMLLSFKTHAASPAATPPAAIAGSGTTGTGTNTVTGDAVETQFGPIQVKITVANGRITSATAVEYPQTNPRDAQINAYAIPVLNQEAVQAGTASIDMVSGATYTSQGYLQSLQSALDKA